MMARICAICHSWTGEGRAGAVAARYQGRILLNEHIAEDGSTVFARACGLGAEGIVSGRVDGYRSGRCRARIKVRNPASIAVQRERSEIWNKRSGGRLWATCVIEITREQQQGGALSTVSGSLCN
jgi:hypothetical protein